MMRLDKLLCDLGEGTRKEVTLRIRRGAVTVDGVTVTRPETKVDPETAVLTLDGLPVVYSKYVYIMMNKAAGEICATRDPKLPTVVSRLPEKLRRRGLFPAGRLDRDAEGLLLLTNDGDAAHMLLSPARHVEKTYFVRYDGALAPDAETRFRNGIAIPADDGDPACVCMPAELIRAGEHEARVKVTEGRYHQVKRMIAAVGGHVTYLRRETFGPLTLDADLRPGAYRELLREEITQIEEIKRKTRRQT